ncbi:alpha/beta hydrolase [Fructobacillus sp. M1-13]|uniref:Alpha/beta hydrolase n=1 Tax=Fructobacillus papyriferae TaxID=2713171 RepID=A0ABS5QQA3_9LACO|nr:alpha/beta hydrolase [Fructobacillus papyriferae]MBS9334670.1 alpha/beta hydrolase [Fructobacillus papyriferae]MCD2158660.1 alpha/beta hydrolase [Fructobacillus papyriferae]
MHKHSRIRNTAIIALLLLIGYAVFQTFSARELVPNQKNKATNQTATVFFHGYGSSRNAEKSMAQYLIDHKYSNRRKDVTVLENGQVDMGRKITASDQNPLVLVQFDNNKNQDFNQTAEWVKAIMTNLKKEGVSQVNLVGHSMGNMAIAFYLMKTAKAGDESLPTVKKQIDLAGTYNGLMLTEPNSKSALNDNGQPKEAMDYFNRLLPLRDYYQQHSIQVLNIYGNSQGAGQNDTTVYNNSSKSLKYFVQSPSTYQEKLITGADGQHSKLHENKEVDQAMLAFLKE